MITSDQGARACSARSASEPNDLALATDGVTNHSGTRRGRNMNARRRVIGGGLAVGVLLLTAAPAGAGQPQVQNLQGTFTETATGANLGYDIHGSAKMSIGANGTNVTVNIAGLDPTKSYGSHLHNGTCASGGGGHYQHDPSGGVTPPNELWLSSTDDAQGPLRPNPGGVAHGSGSATWEARISSANTNARSVVVHEPGSGVRITCADLT